MAQSDGRSGFGGKGATSSVKTWARCAGGFLKHGSSSGIQSGIQNLERVPDAKSRQLFGNLSSFIVNGLTSFVRHDTKTFEMPRGAKRLPGRPKLGDARIECVVSQAVFDALKKREALSGIYRTRIAAGILTNELIGGIVRR